MKEQQIDSEPLFEVLVPASALILSPLTTRKRCDKLYKDWLEDTHKNRLPKESGGEWLSRISVGTSKWLEKAKNRKKYRLYYDLVFWLKLKYIMLKRNYIKN